MGEPRVRRDRRRDECHPDGRSQDERAVPQGHGDLVQGTARGAYRPMVPPHSLQHDVLDQLADGRESDRQWRALAFDRADRTVEPQARIGAA